MPFWLESIEKRMKCPFHQVHPDCCGQFWCQQAVGLRTEAGGLHQALWVSNSYSLFVLYWHWPHFLSLLWCLFLCFLKCTWFRAEKVHSSQLTAVPFCFPCLCFRCSLSDTEVLNAILQTSHCWCFSLMWFFNLPSSTDLNRHQVHFSGCFFAVTTGSWLAGAAGVALFPPAFLFFTRSSIFSFSSSTSITENFVQARFLCFLTFPENLSPIGSLYHHQVITLSLLMIIVILMTPRLIHYYSQITP